MGKVYELYALEGLLDMEAEELPLDIWIPYVQLESERFICKDTGEVWQRFEGATVYMEDEDYPEGDLIEEVERVPEGLVCWLGKNRETPEPGDVFRVLDRSNAVVFEETISGEARLYGRTYASAVKEGDFTRTLLLDVEQAVKSGLGDSFGSNLCNYVALEDATVMVSLGQEKVEFTARGIPFELIVDEYETKLPCRLSFFEADGKHIHSYERNLSEGDKWVSVHYCPVRGGGPGMTVGWGIGTAENTAVKIRNILDAVTRDFSLEGRLAAAAKSAENGFGNKSKTDVEKIMD